MLNIKFTLIINNKHINTCLMTYVGVGLGCRLWPKKIEAHIWYSSIYTRNKKKLMSFGSLNQL